MLSNIDGLAADKILDNLIANARLFDLTDLVINGTATADEVRELLELQRLPAEISDHTALILRNKMREFYTVHGVK